MRAVRGSVNLSARQLHDHSLVDDVAAITQDVRDSHRAAWTLEDDRVSDDGRRSTTRPRYAGL